MKNTTIDRYRNAIIELIETKAEFGYVSRDHFNDVTIKHKITRALPTYLQRVNVIEKAGKNRFKFIKSPTIGDIKSIGKIVFTDNALNKRKNKPNNKQKNAEQMAIETSVPKVNVITTDSDEFARQAMAYLESRGFKVTKEKLSLPILAHRIGLANLRYDTRLDSEIFIKSLAESESTHICKAYRAGYEAGQSGKYKTAEQYLADEYNDFTS
jgi:hypothetical protein